MTITPVLTAALLGMPVRLPPRLVTRPLSDIATIGVPASLEGDTGQPVRTARGGRISFTFARKFAWASFMSRAVYRQQLVVSLMSPDATDAEYAAPPREVDVSYVQRGARTTVTRGTATLTVTECTYEKGTERVPAVEYVLTDRARRLQLRWHAVTSEMDRAGGMVQVERVATSLRMLRDPAALFTAMREAPAREAAEQARKVAAARAMLQREGVPGLEAGVPVQRDGVWVEWMDDPEPRYQLLLPLGRVRAAPAGNVVARPRPAADDAWLPGTIGWREHTDGAWRFTNGADDYLPLPGVASRLAAAQQDTAWVYFYLAATVRVAETEDERLLTSLRWFVGKVPEVQARWRAGRLLSVGTPAPQ